MQVVVARVGRPHGVRGEVTVEVRTDDPDRRLAPGSTLRTDPRTAGPLTIGSARDHNGRLLLTFDGVGDRTSAEALRDVLLLAEVEPDADDEPDTWHVSTLVGLVAVDAEGRRLGEVVDLLGGAAQDLLVVREPSGHQALVPFVRQIVPEVDVEAGHVVLDPPGGLLQDGPEVPADVPSADGPAPD
ncbi:ribosome maturation factor RimM [Thalassiella azotivora]